MTTPTCVTVPGPDVSAEVTWDQVTAYLERSGWSIIWTTQSGAARWQCVASPHPGVLHGGGCTVDRSGNARDIRDVIVRIAECEGRRHPADVLRDIARAGRPDPECECTIPDVDEKTNVCGACGRRYPPRGARVGQDQPSAARDRIRDYHSDGFAPLTKEEIVEIAGRSRGLVPDPSSFWTLYYERDVPRLLATVRAQAEEIARLRLGLTPMECGHSRDALYSELHATAQSYCTICRLHAELNELETDDDAVRSAMGARDDENTMDAVRRVLRERGAEIAELRRLLADERWGT